MARSIWTGTISFGLVTVPVKLYSAVSRKTVRFHQLHETTGARIQQKRVDPQTGEEVPYDEIVKGYEIGPDRYVIVTPDELEALDPKKTRTIDIEDFVDLDDIDPIFYDHPYYLAPGPGGAKPYRLLLEAMRETNKVAVARVVIRSKENLVAIRPMGDVLGMTTMIFADEVIDPDRIDDMPDPDEVRATDRELEIAKQLVESLAGDFEPDKYHDSYREEVLSLIERKAAGEEISVQAPRARPHERAEGQPRRRAQGRRRRLGRRAAQGQRLRPGQEAGVARQVVVAGEAVIVREVLVVGEVLVGREVALARQGEEVAALRCAAGGL
jgi:DNA end-binding protein Ku